MAQSCLKFLKYTMCIANLLCFMCGLAVLGFGIYMTMKIANLTPSLASFSVSNMLLVSGIVITCVSFLGFVGALKENRCLLLSFFLLLFLLMLVELSAACLLLLYEKEIGDLVRKDLEAGLKKAKHNSTETLKDWDMVQEMFKCCGVNATSDWGNNVPKSCCIGECETAQPSYYKQGCLEKLGKWFEENFLNTGITVIILCVVEVLGMCFAMTLFCHIRQSGLGYKL